MTTGTHLLHAFVGCVLAWAAYLFLLAHVGPWWQLAILVTWLGGTWGLVRALWRWLTTPPPPPTWGDRRVYARKGHGPVVVERIILEREVHG